MDEVSPVSTLVEQKKSCCGSHFPLSALRGPLGWKNTAKTILSNEVGRSSHPSLLKQGADYPLHCHLAALNALNQFLKSRETAIFTPHQVVIQGFRDHIGLFKAAHEGPHLPSGIEAWGEKRAEKKISQWEEECWFIRDMEGCLKAFWEDSMCRPGADRMKVTVYDKFGKLSEREGTCPDRLAKDS